MNFARGMDPDWLSVDNIDRRSNLSVEDFIREYEEPNIPVVITDVACKWKGFGKWTSEV